MSLQNEIWKDIPGYEGCYQVSNLGRVKSLDRIVHRSDGRIQHKREHILKLSEADEYYVISLHKSAQTTYHTVHRLVASAFLDNPEQKQQINHIDGDKHNNCISNLEWATSSENMQHAHRLGLVDCTKIGSATSERFNNEEFRIKHKQAVQLACRTPEFRRKQSEIRKTRGYHRAVICKDTGQVFPSIKEAAAWVARDTSSIIDAIKHNSRCAGYHWEYAGR